MKAQKRAGFTKVTTSVRTMIQPHKPIQRVAPSKIQHAHSCYFDPARRGEKTGTRRVPDSFPGVACAV